jgi:predicted nucleic acid-binding protein
MMISSNPSLSSNPAMLVIDAGVGYALCTQTGTFVTLRAEFATQVRQGTRLFAPTIWQFEVTSILTKSVHFRQLSELSARQALSLSGELSIQFIQPDQELVTQAFDWTLRLKRAAAYDSFYLALSRRLGCDLWTMDRRLANAVAEPWVRHVGNAS